MHFNNTENEHIHFKEGDVVDRDINIWASRSVGIVLSLIVEWNNKRHVLMVQRGEKAADNVGWWCLPCGYIDWDESGAEAAIRETWEEAHINLKIVLDHCEVLYDDTTSDKPWMVISCPKSDRLQNVCLHYGIVVKTDDISYFEAQFAEAIKASNGETSQVELTEIPDLYEMKIAFNHLTRIYQFLQRIG